MNVQFGEEDGVSSGEAAEKELHERWEIPVGREKSGRDEVPDGVLVEMPVNDDVTDMVADFAVAHVQFKVSDDHAEICAGDKLGRSGTHLLVLGEDRVVEVDLKNTVLMGDLEVAVIQGVTTAESQLDPFLFLVCAEFQPFVLAVIEEGAEGGAEVRSGGFDSFVVRHGRDLG